MSSRECPSCGHEVVEDQVREFCSLAPINASTDVRFSNCVRSPQLKAYPTILAQEPTLENVSTDPCIDCPHNKVVETPGTRIAYVDNGQPFLSPEYEVIAEKHRCGCCGTEFLVSLKE